MKNIINSIKESLNCLEDRDKELGLQFLKDKNIGDLKDLVDSSIQITKKRIKTDPDEVSQYSDTLERLIQLKEKVDLYYSQFDYPADLYFNNITTSVDCSLDDIY